mmetsp:Transcript_11139/g.24140  ORF Transcript_11139/g.24140 Transcript_11139/m.24140 type:complete len:273 (+) Transcript_11139:1235-2053(+)
MHQHVPDLQLTANRLLLEVQFVVVEAARVEVDPAVEREVQFVLEYLPGLLDVMTAEEAADDGGGFHGEHGGAVGDATFGDAAFGDGVVVHVEGGDGEAGEEGASVAVGEGYVTILQQKVSNLSNIMHIMQILRPLNRLYNIIGTRRRHLQLIHRHRMQRMHLRRPTTTTVLSLRILHRMNINIRQLILPQSIQTRIEFVILIFLLLQELSAFGEVMTSSVIRRFFTLAFEDGLGMLGGGLVSRGLTLFEFFRGALGCLALGSFGVGFCGGGG